MAHWQPVPETQTLRDVCKPDLFSVSPSWGRQAKERNRALLIEGFFQLSAIPHPWTILLPGVVGDGGRGSAHGDKRSSFCSTSPNSDLYPFQITIHRLRT